MKVKRLPCPTCGHPIFVSIDTFIAVAHNDSSGSECPISNNAVPNTLLNQYDLFPQELP